MASPPSRPTSRSDPPRPAVSSPFSSSSPSSPSSPTSPTDDADADAQDQNDVTAASRLRRASVRILDANPPSGMWHATGHIAAKAPTLKDIRRGSFGHSGWTAEGQADRSRSGSVRSDTRAASSRRVSFGRRVTGGSERAAGVAAAGGAELGSPMEQDEEVDPLDSSRRESRRTEPEHPKLTLDAEKVIANTMAAEAISATVSSDHHHHHKSSKKPHEPVIYPNGYRPPPKHTWAQATVIALKGFWRFVLTPFGFLVTVYGLNVVAWGGMLFLLLLNAAPAMCRPTCNDINSPRRKWIEIDSQILNALFCVTGFGLIPWRFRDWFYLLQWRVLKRRDGLRRLAGIHKAWFRLPGSDKLPPILPDSAAAAAPSPSIQLSLPLPTSAAPDAPLTGVRAPPTALWKLDFVVDMYVLNTFLQAVLCAFMWGYDRYDRPSWSTGTFVALACIVAGAAGIMVFVEGRKVKKVEGVPVSEEDLTRLDEETRGRPSEK